MTAVKREFWAGKRVLVTGHTGFKGSWLCLWLQSMKADVFGFAFPPFTAPALFNELRSVDFMTSIECDIRDYDAVSRAMTRVQPEIVIHMAAQALVRYSYRHPVETYATNVMGTVHVLEAARQIGTVKAIVNVTTDKCYENKEWVWGYRENESMGGHDPYSSSKGCSELVSSAYRRSFFEEGGICLATARAGNVIGGGDWSTDRLVPDILRSFERKEPVVIRSPNAIRPWQHVLEPLSGYLLLAEQLYSGNKAFAEAWNFGPAEEDARPVQWIVERMCSLWEQEARWQLETQAQPHEAHFLKLDISKARSQLGWFPVWSLETALQNIVAWHKHWLESRDVRSVCLEQIARYEAAQANR